MATATKNGNSNTANPLATITPRTHTSVMRNDPAMLGKSAIDSFVDATELTRAVRTFISQEFKAGIHYGAAFPGSPKPSLLKAGAQMIQMFLNCRPDVDVELIELGNGHLEVRTTVRLVNRTTDGIIAWGKASCSTMEGKHRYRNADKKCPSCEAEAIRKGAEKFGGGFYCNQKAGGCGAKYAEDDTRITSQVQGKVENENPWDVRNTVEKMSYKRALVAAADDAACLSEFFTQDVDDTFTEDEIARMSTPYEDLAAFDAARTKTASQEPRQPAPPTSPAASLPPDVSVLGQTTAGHDARSYLHVARDAAVEGQRLLAEIYTSHGATAPKDVIKSVTIHTELCRLAIEQAVIEKGAKGALSTITEDVYPSHRDWVRATINSLITGWLDATRNDFEIAGEQAETKTERQPGEDG